MKKKGNTSAFQRVAGNVQGKHKIVDKKTLIFFFAFAGLSGKFGKSL
jgi:hypothetical protein